MSTKKPVLGRGLSALIPGKDEPRHLPGSPAEVSVARLHPNRMQPRTRFEPGALTELARSIRSNGIVQPIVVSPRPDGDFSIIAGERRFRAAKEAGLKSVPVVVRPSITEAERLELALVENLQRQDLNAMEEAGAFGRLRDEFHLTQDQIAEKVGKDRSSIANSLRLLKLCSGVREQIREGLLTAGHAKAIAALSSADDQQRLADEIIRRALSVRQAEARAAAILKPEIVVRRDVRRDPFTREAEEKLARRLAARVRILRRRRGGKIEIAFGSEEELIRLYELLTGKN
jgi:ParB family chromosome partitioning protein